MGNNFCQGTPTNLTGSLTPTSGIYLSNPQNISLTQMRGSGVSNFSLSTSQFLGM